MITDATCTWSGKQLPLWSFRHWKDLENFLDNLCPAAYMATIKPALQPAITGIIFSKDPNTVETAVSGYVITDPEPE